MSRYIDADALKSVIVEKRFLVCDTICKDIDSIPTADVAPVVHGQWIEAENGVCQCSVCKNDPWWKDNCVNPFKNWNYCPNCGAKMS